MKIVETLQRVILRFSKYEEAPNQLLNSILASEEARNFTKSHLHFSPKVSRILNRDIPRVDRYILDRNPKLEWSVESNPRILVDKNYSPEGEIRINNAPYEALYKSMQVLLTLQDVSSLLEIGCTSGNLLALVNKNHKYLKLSGIEIFNFLKEAAPRELQENILIRDLRDPISDDIKSDIVLCLEVAEHIDPNYLDSFLDNLFNLTNKYLVMSWSTSYPEKSAPPQHVSPVWKFQYKRIMKDYGFKEEKALTRSLKAVATSEMHFHKWWLSTITVWSKTEK